MSHPIAPRGRVAGLFAFVALSVAAPAAAQSPCTAITSLPYTITSSGNYCLKQSFITSIAAGSAITISSGYVVLDLGGFSINNLPGGTGALSTGIAVNNIQNVTIRNGYLHWFRTGILVSAPAGGGHSRNITVEDVGVHYPQHTGISVKGSGIVVRRCAVRRVGSGNFGIGILVDGTGGLVEGNFVTEMIVTNGRGIQASGEGHLIVGNRITNPNNYGVFSESATTKYRDNLVTGAYIAYEGGIDAGNNN